MLSHALPNAILFFDEHYLPKDYAIVKEQVFPPQDIQQLETLKVIHGGKLKADQRIIETLQKMAKDWALEKEQRDSERKE